MIGKIFLYLGALLPFLWGLAHLFPTRSVVRGFGEISHENKHIITMEWIIEGIALMFTGISVATLTFIDPTNILSKAFYVLSSVFLIILAVVSLFTGFKIKFLPFKLCPIIFTSSAILITLGWVILNQTST